MNINLYYTRTTNKVKNIIVIDDLKIIFIYYKNVPKKGT